MLWTSQPTNKNHHQHYDPAFRGLPVMVEHLPMVTEMLDSLHGVVSCALSQYSRVFAFRFDLHLPAWLDADPSGFSNTAISKFVDSLKAKIRHNRDRALAAAGRAHDTKVRYFWVREVGDGGRVHFHFVVLLNGNSFNWLGNYQSTGDNMAVRVYEAWASALGLNVEQARQLVTFPEHPSFMLTRDDPESVAVFFHRASYLCKVRTKHSGYGHHGYNASRG